MPVVQLSAHFVRNAVCPPGRAKVDYYDSAIKGFILEVRSSGGRTFYLRYQMSGVSCVNTRSVTRQRLVTTRLGRERCDCALKWSLAAILGGAQGIAFSLDAGGVYS